MPQVKTSKSDVPDALKQFRWLASFEDKSVHLGIGPTEWQAVADLITKYWINQVSGGAR